MSLSAKGLDAALKIKDQYADVTSAVEEILSQANHDLWKAIEEWEYLLEQNHYCAGCRNIKNTRKQ